MATLGQTIQIARSKKGLSADSLAALAGVQPMTVSYIERDLRDRPQPATLVKLAEALDIDPEHLIALAGQRTDTGATGDARGKPPIEGGEWIVRTRRIPILNSVPAGEAIMATNGGFPPGVADEWIGVPEVDGETVDDPNAFALRLAGQSLEPDYRDGGIAIITPNLGWENGDLCLIRFMDGGVTCKYCRATDNQLVYWGGDRRETVRPRSEVDYVYPVRLVVSQPNRRGRR